MIGTHRDIAFWSSLLFSAAVLLTPPPPDAGPDLPGLDKLVHAALFCLVALTALGRFGRRTAVVLAVVGYALGTELVQGLLLAGRSGDALDVVADLVGVALAWLLAGRGRARLG